VLHRRAREEPISKLLVKIQKTDFVANTLRIIPQTSFGTPNCVRRQECPSENWMRHGLLNSGTADAALPRSARAECADTRILTQAKRYE
jgi:hypothetical protein